MDIFWYILAAPFIMIARGADWVSDRCDSIIKRLIGEEH